MSTPRLLNKYKDQIPGAAVYIGRPSRWGNPVRTGVGRLEAIRKYETFLYETPEGRELLSHVEELRGRDLVCYCSPLPCHGDILLRLANA